MSGPSRIVTPSLFQPPSVEDIQAVLNENAALKARCAALSNSLVALVVEAGGSVTISEQTLVKLDTTLVRVTQEQDHLTRTYTIKVVEELPKPEPSRIITPT